MNLQLKQLRKQNGNLTQEQLAQALGTTKRVVGSWERGETQITLEDTIEVCRVLNCTPNDLCGWYIDNPQDAPVAKADARAGLSRDETALISDYRSCTPERKRGSPTPHATSRGFRRSKTGWHVVRGGRIGDRKD